MLQPLPAETVFEAKRRAVRNTWLLFSVLAALYLVIFNLMGMAAVTGRTSGVDPVQVALLSSLIALVSAGLHYSWASSRPLSHLADALQAKPAVNNDELHKRFLNVVEEARLAAGLDAVTSVVVPDLSLNAFSVEDSGGKKMIGITEGLLSKLSRAELEAVIAHEAAHLAHGDSRVVMTACSLFSVFLIMNRVLRPGRRSSHSKAGSAILVIWLLSMIGYFMARVISMAISRNREYLADSHAVHMCKDPLALSSALKKISTSNRGAMRVPEGFSPVFIMNPQYAALDEQKGVMADLFSTHPPVESRLERLMKWAKQDVPAQPASSATGIYVRSEDDGAWKGPLDPAVATTQQLVQPTSWVAENGEIKSASRQPVLYEAFVRKLSGNASGVCPRCEMPLEPEQYEGMPILKCHYCGGTLLYAGGIEKAVMRNFERFHESKISDAVSWRALQKGTIKDLCSQPHIACPLCRNPMFKSVHTELTCVVIDRCLNKDCDSAWCDGGELERIQILVEHASIKSGPS